MLGLLKYGAVAKCLLGIARGLHASGPALVGPATELVHGDRLAPFDGAVVLVVDAGQDLGKSTFVPRAPFRVS